MADIFISYAQGDRDWVKELATALEAEGYSVWWDPNLVAGARYREKIDEELGGASAVVVIWSNLSVHSDYVRDEAEDARLGAKLVPVLKDAVRVPAGFRQLQTTDLSQWRGRRESPEFQKLIGGIQYVANANAARAAKSGGGSEAVADAPVRVRTVERPQVYVPPPAPPKKRNALGDLKIVGIVVAGVIAVLGGITYIGYLAESGQIHPDVPPDTTAQTASTNPGLNPRVAAAVEAAQNAERQARDRANRAWTVNANARAAAQEAHDAALKAAAKNIGYSSLIGKYSDGTAYDYEGQVVNGQADGFGVLSIESTGYRYEGHWKLNQHDGLGIETFKNGDAFAAEYTNGDASGLGVYSFGTGKWVGDVYAGEFKKGTLTGLGVYKTAATGQEDAGYRKESNPDSYSVAHFSDGSWWAGEWKLNKLEGVAAKFDAKGNIIEQGVYSGGALKEPLTPQSP